MIWTKATKGGPGATATAATVAALAIASALAQQPANALAAPAREGTSGETQLFVERVEPGETQHIADGTDRDDQQRQTVSGAKDSGTTGSLAQAGDRSPTAETCLALATAGTAAVVVATATRARRRTHTSPKAAGAQAALLP